MRTSCSNASCLVANFPTGVLETYKGVNLGSARVAVTGPHTVTRLRSGVEGRGKDLVNVCPSLGLLWLIQLPIVTHAVAGTGTARVLAVTGLLAESLAVDITAGTGTMIIVVVPTGKSICFDAQKGNQNNSENKLHD